MSQELRQKNIAVTVEANNEMALLIDPVLMEQVMINLITNGVHAVEGQEQPRIELRTGFAEHQAIISIHDNGKGIPTKELTEIFVPFFTTKKDGSGIGLSLAKQIMSLHNGSIRVLSQPGAGTTFFLHFPLPIHRI
jgi:signal transduction histidine kinase